MIGPSITKHATCVGCEKIAAEKYVCQSDWGYDYYCDDQDRRYIGTNCKTPNWCPYLTEDI